MTTSQFELVRTWSPSTTISSYQGNININPLPAMLPAPLAIKGISLDRRIKTEMALSHLACMSGGVEWLGGRLLHHLKAA